jgi:hypothetical protein
VICPLWENLRHIYKVLLVSQKTFFVNKLPTIEGGQM